MKFIITRENNFKSDQVYFVPCNSGGAPGNLNSFVLESIGFNFKTFPNSNDLINGFAFRRIDEKKTVVFIVTVGGNPSTAINLYQNLKKAFFSLQNELKDKTIWIPLMGTGHGGLSEGESSQYIFDAIREIQPPYLPSVITIACPRNISNEDYGKIEIWAKSLESQQFKSTEEHTVKSQPRTQPSSVKSTKQNPTKNLTESEQQLNGQLKIIEELKNSERNFWWINASQKEFNGDIYNYPTRDKNNNAKARFSQLRIGDL